MINRKLAKDMKLDNGVIKKIEYLQDQRSSLFAYIYSEYDKETIAQYQLDYWVSELRFMNFELQSLWGFDVNENYHYWFDIPHCSCPKMDNTDLIGTDMNIYSEDCPFHGHRVTERKEAQYQHNREIKRWNEHDLRMIRNSFEEAIGDAMDKVRESYND